MDAHTCSITATIAARPASDTRSWKAVGRLRGFTASLAWGDATILHVEAYTAQRKSEWDEFVKRSKNAVFLFHRDYMEYHADRFTDASLLVLDDDKLIAVIPGNRDGTRYVSHGGLTFGGVLTDSRMRGGTMLEVFGALFRHLRQQGYERVTYKAVPHIYHRLPAEEDLYALFRSGARLVRRDLASTLVPGSAPPYTKGRKWGIKKGKDAGLDLGLSNDWTGFMKVENANLSERHGVTAVHTAEEMILLSSRFPENMKLYTATYGGAIAAGVVIYESERVAHAQYIATTEEGRQRFALDALIDFLLSEEFRAKPYFDFGISTEERGWRLNEGLSENKESYGGRSVVYDFYEIDLGSDEARGIESVSA